MTRPTPYHLHYCDHHCGDYFMCSRRDGCDLQTWTCPNCELDDLDAHWTAEGYTRLLKAVYEPEPDKETDDEGF